MYASVVRAVSLLLLILGSVCLASAWQNPGEPKLENDSGDAAPASGVQLIPAEKELYDIVNQERKNQNLPLFALDDNLIFAARKHSQEMAMVGKLSHKFPDEPILSLRLAQAGAHFDSVAENVALSGSPEDAHIEFMHSPGHRANLLNPAYNTIGIGIVEKGEEIFVTEDFSHRVPEQTTENIERQILKQINQIRGESGMAALERVDAPQLQVAACQPGITAHEAIRYLPGAGSMVVFGQAEINDLPEQLKKAAIDPSAKHVVISVCYPPGSQTGFSMFTALVGVYK